MNDLLRRINEWWSKLSLTARTAIIAGVVALIVLLSVLGQWIGRVQYTPLFSRLEPQDAGRIVDELKSIGVSYQLADEGKTVLVPEEKVYDLRLQLAGQEMVPNAGLGFELFDQNQLGMTDYQRHINYLRAMQEELRRTIVQLEEVEQARVHLVIPQPSVFIEDQQPASASIALKLRPFSGLKPGQVKGIVSLVAGSVEGLSHEDVTVIDMQGNILSDGVGLEKNLALGEEALRQQELTRAFEKDMESRLQKLLQRILGPNKAVAMVSAELNFDQREVTRIEFGDDGAVRSEQILEETEVSAASGGGAVATDPNLQPNPNTYPELGNESQRDYQRNESTTNYEIDQMQESIVYAPGRLENISVAVALDTELDNEQQLQVSQLVAAAVGQPVTQIELLPMAFDTSYQEELAEAMAFAEEANALEEEQLRRYVTWGGIGLALLLVLVVVLLLFLRRRQPGAAAQQLQQQQKQLAAQQYAAAQELPPEEKQRQRQYKDARDFAGKKVDETVKLLRSWMAEEE